MPEASTRRAGATSHEQVSVMVNHLPSAWVVAGLVPATPIAVTLP